MVVPGMRAAILFLLGTAASAGSITFVTPQENSQAVGLMLVEVNTDLPNVDRVEFYVDGVLAGVARSAPYRIGWDFGTSLAAREITAKVSSNGFRQTDTAKVRTAALTAGESIDVDVVEVPLRARSREQLRPSDLRIRENGVEQAIRELQPQRGPAHFVFLIDRSLSMGDGKLTETLSAVDEQRKLLRPDDRVSVILFNHNVAQVRAVQRGEKLAAVFGEITPSGGTSLRDALASIPARDRVYAIAVTDGGDRNSELSEEEALRKISGTRIIVDAVVLATRSRFLEKAARNTGGEVVEAGRGEIGRQLRGLILDINSRYLLVYQSHGTRRGWRSIEVKARRGGIAIVNARKGYFSG